MFNHNHYVPILKWKMGEYQALSRLSDPVKAKITPLLEIPPVGFDFETQTNKETLDSHIGDFGKRLKSKWQARPCFVDLKYVSLSPICAGGKHCVEVLFDTARAEGCVAIPVVSLRSDPAFIAAVGAVARQDRNGVCLRLYLPDFDRANLTNDIESLLRQVADGWGYCDLVVDLEAQTYIPMTVFVTIMQTLLSKVPALNRWRTVTIAGTSYPATVAGIQSPSFIPRMEWQSYKALLPTLGSGGRIPTFGDYAVAHPDPIELDMRLVKPFAKMRYTITDYWYYEKGAQVRSHGFGQFQSMCATIMAQPWYSGAHFSAGDAYIADCAAGKVATGNLSTWVWVSTNHHLTKVVDDLAIAHGLSAAA
ncbi:beta family protein [Bradyrhizobium brasilense]|uniref:beta family protein n=1 Tax=Bradyrhizobium brasilense TaxID=1419277 RepID=UPI0024B1A9AE|nr:beta family protein [Bradyrhizobium australafricanum]WFU36318.1 beta family protein [Bradyrhizobium australafricanum]